MQRGESILVCDRDHVVARIERVDAHAPLPEGEGEWKPVVGADVVTALLREREEGR